MGRLQRADPRTISPELKRHVKNMACKHNKYAYCADCHEYKQVESEPINNIYKFMEYIKGEQLKLNPPLTQKQKAEKKKQRNPNMENDSVSDITDLSEEEILNKYYKDKTRENAPQPRNSRSAARARLLGEVVKSPKNMDPHLCAGPVKTQKRQKKDKVIGFVEMELRHPQPSKVMVDD